MENRQHGEMWLTEHWECRSSLALIPHGGLWDQKLWYSLAKLWVSAHVRISYWSTLGREMPLPAVARGKMMWWRKKNIDVLLGRIQIPNCSRLWRYFQSIFCGRILQHPGLNLSPGSWWCRGRSVLQYSLCAASWGLKEEGSLRKHRILISKLKFYSLCSVLNCLKHSLMILLMGRSVIVQYHSTKMETAEGLSLHSLKGARLVLFRWPLLIGAIAFISYRVQ